MAGNPPLNIQQLEETIIQRQRRLVVAFVAWERTVGQGANNRRQILEEILQLLNVILESSQEPDPENLVNVENTLLRLNDAHLRARELQGNAIGNAHATARVRNMFLMEMRKAPELEVVDLATARWARRLAQEHNWIGRFVLRLPNDINMEVAMQINNTMNGLNFIVPAPAA